MKRKINTLLVLLLCAVGWAMPVFANSPPSAEYSTGVNVLGLLFWAVLILSSIAKTLASEWLVALLFGVERDNTLLIVLTNVITQIVMWVTYIPLVIYGRIDHILVVVILEILIYLSELLVYRKWMKEVRLVKCLAYTVTANTASLLLGLLMG